MSTDELFLLTWAEYNDKLEHQRRKSEEWWAHDRLKIATMWNTRFGAKEMVKPTDIIRLSIDDENSETMPYSPEELDEQLRGIDTLFDRLRPLTYGKDGKTN